MSGPCPPNIPSDGDLQHARDVAILACLEADPECNRLVQDAKAVSLAERRRWSGLRGLVQGDSTRVATEAHLLFAAAGQCVAEAEDSARNRLADGVAGNTARCQNEYIYLRVFRYVGSERFQKSVRDGDWKSIGEDVLKEIGLAVGIEGVTCLSNLEPIKTTLSSFLEKLPRAVKVAGPHVLLFVAFCLFSPRGTGSWKDLGIDLTVAALKTCLVRIAPIWTTILAIQFLDDVGSQRAALIRDGYTGNATVAAAKSAFRKHPVVVLARGVWGYFYRTDQAVDTPPLHLDKYIHEEFEDVSFSMEPLVDPVFLHGFAFSCASLEYYFAETPRTEWQHPVTRAPIRRGHVLEPPPEFLRLRAEYLRRRDEIIRDCGAGAGADGIIIRACGAGAAAHPHAD